jgi:hypothetical protein
MKANLDSSYANSYADLNEKDDIKENHEEEYLLTRPVRYIKFIFEADFRIGIALQ